MSLEIQREPNIVAPPITSINWNTQREGRRQNRPMIIVLFRSKLVVNPEGYDAMADEMDVLAKTMPGFIEVKSYKANDGERLTVVWWEDAETLKQWREQERHRVAQHQGRQQWYEYYKMEVADVTRISTFDRRA
jgi:heme-degrading monooxygenase HmoA